jgi:hypothetical protein
MRWTSRQRHAGLTSRESGTRGGHRRVRRQFRREILQRGDLQGGTQGPLHPTDIVRGKADRRGQRSQGLPTHEVAPLPFGLGGRQFRLHACQVRRDRVAGVESCAGDLHPLLGRGHQFAAQVTGLFLVKGDGKLALHPAVEFESLAAGFEAEPLAVEVLDPGGLLAAVPQRDRDPDARQVVRVARCVSPEGGVLHPGDGFRIGTDTRLLNPTFGRSNQRARLDEIRDGSARRGPGLVPGSGVDRGAVCAWVTAVASRLLNPTAKDRLDALMRMRGRLSSSDGNR